MRPINDDLALDVLKASPQLLFAQFCSLPDELCILTLPASIRKIQRQRSYLSSSDTCQAVGIQLWSVIVTTVVFGP